MPRNCLAPFIAIELLAFVLAAHAQAIPPDAINTISNVRSAALARNYAQLRGMMVEEFTWSFGGDGSADQAIAVWKTKSTYMKELARVTKGKCGQLTPTVIQCPVEAGTRFRAGFEFAEGSWRMTYFVAGD